MIVTFLGTGTSTGVPQIGCNCEVCTSSDARDQRLRCSALVSLDNGQNLLIDCGPDFRTQMLAAGQPPVHAALLTHSHYDHVGGIDDLRPYCIPDGFSLYCQADVAQDLRTRVPYGFAVNHYPGAPVFHIHTVDPHEPFTVAGVQVVPLPVMHASLPIIGFRIGSMAYVTDCKVMPPETEALLQGLDLLVINTLGVRQHHSHMSLSDALPLIARIGAKRTYLTHMSHRIGLHANSDSLLPPGVHLAYDGLRVKV